jgi:hypothetical protein
MIEEILWEGEGAPTWLETPVTEVPALKPPVDKLRAQRSSRDAAQSPIVDRLDA